MIPFAQCTYRAQVARLRKLAQRALTQYGFEIASVRLIAHWNNATFDVRDQKGERYVLRIGRPGFQDVSQVASEVLWLSRIEQETELCVPHVVATTLGERVIEVGADGVPEDRVCVLFHRRHGFFYDRKLMPHHYEQAGQLMAQLHLSAQAFVAPMEFERKAWTVETALGCVSAVDQAAFKALLRPGDEVTYLAVWDWYAEVWHTLGLHEDVYGVIHGDFHPRNILFMPNGVGAIDFDECGWGHYLHDVAVALMGIRNHKRSDDLRFAFLKGYRAVRDLPEVLDGALDAFVAGRLLGLAVWTAGVTDHPWNREKTVRVVRETMDELGQKVKGKRQK
ncbi:MAG: phosphotransferase [Candidatus Latescibacteria bacterium]|jgi:Ser/Thr protein kinase RdoA (MazF antagonist)|nr:phosphotransferase [Candidatus Latescibacterota bacterium]